MVWRDSHKIEVPEQLDILKNNLRFLMAFTNFEKIGSEKPFTSIVVVVEMVYRR